MASVVDTTVKHFHSGQIGAPVLTGAAGSMIALLDACLVNGFGLKSVDSLVVSGGVATIGITGTHSAQVDMVVSVAGVTNLTTLNGEQKVTAVTATTIKFATAAANGTATGTITVKQAPAGWAKPFTGSNLAVYRSDDVTSNRRYVRIADTTTYTSRINVYESMTAVSTGTGPMPTSAQVSGGGYLVKGVSGYGAVSDVANWAVFANGKRVLIYVMPLIAVSPSYNGGVLLGFGDFPSLKSGDVYNTFLAAMPDAATFYSLGGMYLTTGFWVQRLHTAAAGAKAGSVAMPFYGGHAAGWGGYGPFPAPVGGGLLLTEGMLWADDLASYGFRGMLPGRWQTPQAVAAGVIAHGDIVTGSGATAGRKLFALHCTDHPTNPAPEPGTFIDITGPWG